MWVCGEAKSKRNRQHRRRLWSREDVVIPRFHEELRELLSPRMRAVMPPPMFKPPLFCVNEPRTVFAGTATGKNTP